jgi:hypothetical protein
MKRQFSAPHFWLKMGKYNQLKNLKKTKARVTHECSHCEETILAGDYYYKEALKKL